MAAALETDLRRQLRAAQQALEAAQPAIRAGTPILRQREQARARRLAARRQARAAVLRQTWTQGLQVLEGAYLDRQDPELGLLVVALRRHAGGLHHCVDVVLVPGRGAPTVTGEEGHWETPGGTLVRHPGAYRRLGRCDYVTSTEILEVPRQWLIRHLRGLATEQAAKEIRH